MKIWKQAFNLDLLNQLNANTMTEYLGIIFSDFGEDYLEASMPADQRTVQPYRILHGGASVVLAETLGSVASFLCIDDINRYKPVGLEINANHLRPVNEGERVVGRVFPLRIGRRLHIWNIEIRNEDGKLTCVSRLTVSIVESEQ
jgi:1,4-dihydroxy-2-naphthoyl-CoA hydrolase